MFGVDNAHMCKDHPVVDQHISAPKIPPNIVLVSGPDRVCLLYSDHSHQTDARVPIPPSRSAMFLPFQKCLKI